jgi:hypothetical protein
MPSEPQSTLPAERDGPVDYFAVQRAARQLLVRGERPTVAGIRQEIGAGSATALTPLLGRFWQELGKDLAGETAVVTRLPASVARAAETLWAAALQESETRFAKSKVVREASTADRERRADIREHVIRLREQELERSLAERDAFIAEQSELLKNAYARAVKYEDTIAALERLVRREGARRRPPAPRVARAKRVVRTKKRATRRGSGKAEPVRKLSRMRSARRARSVARDR